MLQSRSVLLAGADICVSEEDYVEISCKDMQYDYSTLNKAILEQARLLEQLLLPYCAERTAVIIYSYQINIKQFIIRN